MASLGESLNDEMLVEMIKEADTDNDGFIDFMGMQSNLNKQRPQ